MQNKIVAISTEVAEIVRQTMRAPVYGFPAHKELVTGAAPCRHCLRLIVPDVDDAILFTYDRFAGVETLPQPGSCTQKSVPDTMSRTVSPKNFAEAHARSRHTPKAGASSHTNMSPMGRSRPPSRACFQTAKSIIYRCTARLPAALHFASNEQAIDEPPIGK